jgi:hypothetical protein
MSEEQLSLELFVHESEALECSSCEGPGLYKGHTPPAHAPSVGFLTYYTYGYLAILRQLEWREESTGGLRLYSYRKIPQRDIPSKRGIIFGLVRSSRRRLMYKVTTLDRRAPALGVHLTYPNVFPTDKEQWTKHRDALRARLDRKFRQVVRDEFGKEKEVFCYSAIWRMGFVKRKSGSNKGEIPPHLHILFYPNLPGDPFPGHSQEWLYEFREWLAQAWYEIVGSNDVKHLGAGTSVEFFKTEHRKRRFVFYLTNWDKVDVASVYPEGTGACWNCWRKENLPISPYIEIPLMNEAQARAIERDLKGRIWKESEPREDIHLKTLHCLIFGELIPEIAMMSEFHDHPMLQNYSEDLLRLSRVT